MVVTAATALALGVAMSEAGSGGQDDAVALARKTLAGTVQLAAERVELERAEPVDWPDASLGCPEKDRMYAQVITPGYRVVLKADGKTYEVHTAGGRAVLCPPAGRPAAPPTRPMLGPAAKVYAAARKDLAGRLNAPEGTVKVNFVRPTTWPNAGLGCPESGQTYAPGPVKGFVIELEAEGKTYRYHADLTSARLCESPAAPPEPRE